jgi:hypothetical protein
MISFIISVIASLSILLGSPAPVAPAPVAQAAQIQQQEAAQQHDSIIMQDAWQTVDDYHVENTSDTVEMMLTYVETVTGNPSATLPATSFALPSLDLEDTYHVFKWDIIKHA